MYNASATYNPYSASRHVEIETQLRIVDEQAAANASCSATDPSDCSSVATLASDGLTNMGGRFFTLEPDYLACDKVFDIMPDNYHAGYWGNSVGANQSLTFTFSAPVTSLGLSLWFDEDANEWPDYVSVQFHKPQNANSSAEDTPDDPPHDVTPERPFSILMFYNAQPITYSAITITIEPKPNRRVRLAGIAFGILQDYRNATIKSWDWDEEADVTAACLPAASQRVEVVADNGQFSILDPELIECIHPGLTIKTSVIVNGERIPMKDTILSEIQDSGNGLTATISSVDNIYQLDAVGFKTDSASTASMWGSANEFVSQVMQRTAGLHGATTSGIPFEMPESIQSIKFYPHRDSNTVRAWLPTIAQALQCHIMQDRDGVIKFINSHSADVKTPVYSDSITKGNATKITQEITQRTNELELVSAIVNTEEDEKTEFVAEISNKHTGETLNNEKLSNGLLSLQIGQGCARWALEQRNRRIKYKAEWRGNPAIDLLDSVSIVGKPAIVTSIHYSFDGVFKGTIEAYCGLYDILQKSTITTRKATEWNP